MSLLKRLLEIIVAPPDDPKPDDLVFVAYSDSEPTAQFWVSILKDAQIPAQAFRGAPLTGFGLGGGTDWRVRVRYADLPRAREVLDLDDNGVPRSEASS